MVLFSRKNVLFAIIILAVPVLASSILFMKGRSIQRGRSQQITKEGKFMEPAANFPCINFDPTAPGLSKEQQEAYEKYQNIIQYGYPTDVPLSQAVKEFNDCATSKEESPLTENEVIAAIIGGAEIPETWSDPKAIQSDFEKILYKRLFPKGARFEISRTTEISLNDEDSRELRAAFNAPKITLKRWVITLYRGLDKKPIEGTPLAPGQAFVIRKRYYGVE
jgi:hypothetical protein